MVRLKFLGMAAALLILAGCAIPVGGYYGGYPGTYGGYPSTNGGYPSVSPYGYSSGYPSGAVVPYGYSGVDPYYGYQQGAVASAPPTVINNHIPVPVNPNGTDVTGTTSTYGNWQTYRRRYRDQNNQTTTTTTTPSVTPSTTGSTVNSGTDTGNNSVANLSPWQQRWANRLSNLQGTQVTPQVTQGAQIANSQGTTYRTRQRMATQQGMATQQMGTPLTGSTMTRPMARPNVGTAVTAAPRQTGNTAVRTIQRAPQARQLSTGQKRVVSGN